MLYIKNMFNNYFYTLSRWKDYKSRSGRKEYWSFNIIAILPYFLLKCLQQFFTQPLVVYCLTGVLWAYVLFTFIPNITLLIRRLHDLGATGKWCILYFLFNIISVFFLNDDAYRDLSLQSIDLLSRVILAMIIIALLLMFVMMIIIVFFCPGKQVSNKYGPPLLSSAEEAFSCLPKGKATNLEIIYTSPEKKYSIAKMNWNGLENSYAIRWNFGLNSWFIIPQKLVSYIDFTRFLNEKELYTLISDKIIMAVKKQKEINPSLFSLSISYNSKKIDPMIIDEIKKILAVEKVTLISFSENIENTVFNVAYT